MPTTVYFASNRILTGDANAVASYGPNLQPPSSPTGLTYGIAFVDGVDLGTNAAGTITSIQETQAGGFAANVADDLANAGRNLLVFLHGFDNTFEDAITRAAFNREFLAASGDGLADMTVLAFSWPSLGKLVSFPVLDADYRHDQKMAQLSGLHVMSFFAQIEPLLRRALANGNRTFLLAHSMGNLALSSAVENWFHHGNGNATLFDVSILAAADCRYDDFEQPSLTGLSGLSQLSTRISIYFNQADKVLGLSCLLNGIKRLGQGGPKDFGAPTFPPSIYKTFDASGISDYDSGFLGSHQYYRLSPAVRKAITDDLALPPAFT